MSETGFARGSLSPVIYFERKDGFCILPPIEVGHGTELARKMLADERYRGWEWREAGTLAEVDRLQKRLVDQEDKRSEFMAQTVGDRSRAVRDAVADSLRQRMCSSATSAYERDFIGLYLQLREEKRDKYRASLEQHRWYLWAREQDSKTKFEDRMPDQPGEFWRTPEQVNNL